MVRTRFAWFKSQGRMLYFVLARVREHRRTSALNPWASTFYDPLGIRQNLPHIMMMIASKTTSKTIDTPIHRTNPVANSNP